MAPWVCSRCSVCRHALLLAVTALLCGEAVKSIPISSDARGLNVTLQDDGSFVLKVDGKAWLSSGNLSYTTSNNTHSTSDGTMVALGTVSREQGMDAFGAFERQTLVWAAASSAAPAFSTSVSVYDSGDKVVFEQAFLPAATGTATQAKGADVSSCFPSFDSTSVPEPMGYLSFQGRFLEASHAGPWDASQPGRPGIGVGDAGGPFALYTQAMTDTLVFSPASQFMAATIGRDANTDALCFGLDHLVTHVPKNFRIKTIVHLGRSGVNTAIKSWGRSLMQYYGTQRHTDFTRQFLGFSTDNGAYYYYNTQQLANGTRLTYEDTILNVAAYAKQSNIPYHYGLLDSWWYEKGDGGGVKNWTAVANIFPHGMEWVHEQTGWKFQLHNRHWSDNNVYALQNGGDYEFVMQPPLSVPTTQRFWNDLIANKSNYIVVYEQDWMYNEFDLQCIRESPTIPRDWLLQMGKGSKASQTTVQYCMTYARMVLTSAEIPAVTTFRASDDYHPGQTGYYPTPDDPSGSLGCRFPYCVYYIGTTSILAHALDLGPSKDNMWTSEVQPGNPYDGKKVNSTREPYSEMQGAVSALSTGPVAPSDAVGFSNVSLIRMTCMADGRLLQPSAPARAIDANFLPEAFPQSSAAAESPVARVQHVYSVMATHTAVAGRRWTHVLAVGLNNSFSLRPSHIAAEVDAVEGSLIQWRGYGSPSNVTLGGAFDEDHPIALTPCGYSDFALVRVAPVFAINDMALLGEADKWVPVSAARFLDVEATTSGITVLVAGATGEQVHIAFAPTPTSVAVATCTITPAGTATVSCSKAGKIVCGDE
eukprot:m.248958 g.248958  ORF g.248958 m.248958 type:complete len:817 (+) comp19081_c0_seq6:1182-3632(+)